MLEAYFDMLNDDVKERAYLDERINRIVAGIRSILALQRGDDDVMPYEERLDDILKPEGFTDAIRKCLRTSLEPLTPAEIKAMLPSVGFDLSGYSNPLASVHTILKRLAKTEDVESVTCQDGKTAYKWVGLGRIARPSDSAAHKAVRIVRAKEEFRKSKK